MSKIFTGALITITDGKFAGKTARIHTCDESYLVCEADDATIKIGFEPGGTCREFYTHQLRIEADCIEPLDWTSHPGHDFIIKHTDAFLKAILPKYWEARRTGRLFNSDWPLLMLRIRQIHDQCGRPSSEELDEFWSMYSKAFVPPMMRKRPKNARKIPSRKLS
mgnify:CR=1 FL=1|tara:strand:- start:95 stop:586 length:492 start_codon:yes stop_codon:yes gene_type:complete